MGILSELLDTAALRREVETHPRMRTLAENLQRRGLNATEANRLLEGILLRALEDTGELYQGTMRAHIERMARLRDQVSSIIESVVSGAARPDARPGQNTESIFAELQHEMDALESPGSQVQREGVKVNNDVVARARAELQSRPLTPEQQRVQSEILQGLDATSRAKVNVAAERAPAPTRRAVFAETETGLATALNEVRAQLQAAGVSPEEIDATVEALTGMNERFTGRNKKFPAAWSDPLTLQGATEAMARARGVADLDAIAKRAQAELKDPAVLNGPSEVRARAQALARLDDPALLKRITRSKYLQWLARESPQMLGELWGKYKSSSSESTFRYYVVEVIMKRHIVGLRGEHVATFQLGEALTMLKSPDLDVTIPGTDMVGVADLTGDVWLIDNKEALNPKELGTVNALTRNLPGNIADDVAEFQQALANQTQEGRTIDPRIQDAVDRLGRASKEIRKLNLTAEQLKSAEGQLQITKVLDRYRIRRVVTNAGGQIRGLSQGLSDIRVELENLNL